MEEPQESILTTKLRTAGGSLEMTIPMQFVEKLGWKEGDEIHLDKKNGKYGPCMTAWNYNAQKKTYDEQKKE
jgi:antitoxin component of MazEF toxin-antitoxin module